MFRFVAASLAALLATGCGVPSPKPESEAGVEEETHADGLIALTSEQVAATGITLVQPGIGSADAVIDVPALLESDPQTTRIVAAPIEGRVVALTSNLGDQVRKGQTLAIIESVEAASLQAEVERGLARVKLAQAQLRRDEALHAQGYRPLREVEISRASSEDADTALRLARQQLSAAGVRGGSLNRIAIASPISGAVVARSAVLGQIFNAENAGGELFRIANLGRLSVTLSLSPADAARVRPGAPAEIVAGARRQQARVRFVSPALDPETRLVRVIADLDNAIGQWRAGEPVQARIRVAADLGRGQALSIPAVAVQTVENKPVVFVRTAQGFRAVPVTLGKREGPMVAVVQGLKGSETIAASNSFILKAELGKGEAGHDEH